MYLFVLCRRFSPDSGPGLGEHVRLDPDLQSDGRVPGAERGAGGGRVLQGPSPHQPRGRNPGRVVARMRQLHRGSGREHPQHLRGASQDTRKSWDRYNLIET